MKKTERYELNQWEASDRIRMEDFNADNLRLEAALLEKTGRLELIRSYDGSESSLMGDGAYMMQCPVRAYPTHDWNDWECVIAVMDFHKTTFQEGEVLKIDLSLEGGITQEKVIIPAGSFVAAGFPNHNGQKNIRLVVLGSGCGTFFLDRPFDDWKYINCILRNEIGVTPAETRFVQPVASVYGIR